MGRNRIFTAVSKYELVPGKCPKFYAKFTQNSNLGKLKTNYVEYVKQNKKCRSDRVNKEGGDHIDRWMERILPCEL